MPPADRHTMRGFPALVTAKLAERGLSPADIARFWSKTRLDGSCLIWTPSHMRFNVGELQAQAVHVAWLIAHGAPPPDKYTQRTCGNLKCVEPSHIISPTEEERFFTFVDKDGPVVRSDLGPCWVWTGAKSRDSGYGQFRTAKNATVRSHRWIWEQRNGALPAHLFVCHKCDNPVCVRPGHLFAGTAKENAHDSIAKGRKATGPVSQRRRAFTPPNHTHLDVRERQGPIAFQRPACGTGKGERTKDLAAVTCAKCRATRVFKKEQRSHAA